MPIFVVVFGVPSNLATTHQIRLLGAPKRGAGLCQYLILHACICMHSTVKMYQSTNTGKNSLTSPT
jgi:hypothetical protein